MTCGRALHLYGLAWWFIALSSLILRSFNSSTEHCLATFLLSFFSFLFRFWWLGCLMNIQCFIRLSYMLASKLDWVGQNVGQNLDFREHFDIAVARAVAEMRILGMILYLLSYFGSNLVYILVIKQFIYLVCSWILSPSSPGWWFVCSSKGSWSSGILLLENCLYLWFY